MREPSEFAKNFTMRLSLNWKNRAGIFSPSAMRSRSTDWTSAIFSSTETSASLRCSGIDQFISIASSCAKVIFVLRREALATLMASSTMARTSDFVRRFVAANPADVERVEDSVLQDEVLLLLVFVPGFGVRHALLHRIIERKIREIRFVFHDDPPRKRPRESGLGNEDIECLAWPPISLWRRGDSGRVHAERRPPDRPVPRIFRPGTDEGPGPTGRETLGRRVPHGPGGQRRRESPRPAARDRGRKGVSVDPVAEGRPRPRACRLLQNLDRPKGREANQRFPVDAFIDGLGRSGHPQRRASRMRPDRRNGSPRRARATR